MRRTLSLDWLIEKFSDRDAAQIDPGALNLLRMGVYQLLFMDKVPDHAAVDATVNMAKKLPRGGLDKFVNAVLRRAARERSNIPWPDREKDTARFMSVFYSHPQWLVELWVRELGIQETEALLNADNVRPKVTLRVNTLKTTRDGLLTRLAEAGVEAEPGRFTPEAIIVERQAPPEIFQEGLAYAQDEASIVVGHVLGPKPGETVLDIGAGPGGKTTHLAQLMNNEGRIRAVDVNPSRLARVKENAERLGAVIVKMVPGDAAEISDSASGIKKGEKADKVLVDAPCSGLGVLARRPDARLRKTPETIEQLAALQKRILAASAVRVRPAGVLVYSVCTIARAETTDVISAFLAEHDDFELMPFSVSLGGKTVLDARDGMLQLLPHLHGTDGMFIAKLRGRS